MAAAIAIPMARRLDRAMRLTNAEKRSIQRRLRRLRRTRGMAPSIRRRYSPGAGPRRPAARRLRAMPMSRSVIFLRRVFRFRPSIRAARSWLPFVAASDNSMSGRSISRMTRV